MPRISTTDLLRKRICTSEKSIPELSEISGVSEKMIRRFVKDKNRNIRLDIADKLFDAVGLHVDSDEFRSTIRRVARDVKKEALKIESIVEAAYGATPIDSLLSRAKQSIAEIQESSHESREKTQIQARAIVDTVRQMLGRVGSSLSMLEQIPSENKKREGKKKEHVAEARRLLMGLDAKLKSLPQVINGNSFKLSDETMERFDRMVDELNEAEVNLIANVFGPHRTLLHQCDRLANLIHFPRTVKHES